MPAWSNIEIPGTIGSTAHHTVHERLENLSIVKGGEDTGRQARMKWFEKGSDEEEE